MKGDVMWCDVHTAHTYFGGMPYIESKSVPDVFSNRTSDFSLSSGLQSVGIKTARPRGGKWRIKPGLAKREGRSTFLLTCQVFEFMHYEKV